MRAAFDRLASRVDTVETNVAVIASATQNKTTSSLLDSDQGKQHEQLNAYQHVHCSDLNFSPFICTLYSCLSIRNTTQIMFLLYLNT